MTLTLEMSSLPEDTPVPATMQLIGELLAQALQITGVESLEGVVIADTEPAVEDQDKVWLQITGTGQIKGFYVYNGGWQVVPLVIPTGDEYPTNPQEGQLFVLTDTGIDGLRIYRGGQWTSALWPMGTTAQRPASPPLNFVYYDTDISRLLIYKTLGWSTVDGAIGEGKVFFDVVLAEALARNPGWAEYTGLQDRFPIGASGTRALETTGGRESFTWQVSRELVDRGTFSQTVVDNIKIDGNQGAAGVVDAEGSYGVENEVSTISPWRAVLWLRKQY